MFRISAVRRTHQPLRTTGANVHEYPCGRRAGTNARARPLALWGFCFQRKRPQDPSGEESAAAPSAGVSAEKLCEIPIALVQKRGGRERQRETVGKNKITIRLNPDLAAETGASHVLATAVFERTDLH